MRANGQELAWLLLSMSCAADEGGCSAPGDIVGIAVPSSDEPQPQPRRDEWRLEIEAPFYAEVVSRISIGGRDEADRLANRGDVVVRFDGEPGRIRVEMRRFDFTADPDAAFERLELYTHRLEDGVWSSQDLPDRACTERWDLDCGVRVLYDGQYQPQGAGADLRVTLPPEYVGSVTVVTNDAHADNYSNAGDVCLLGLRGSAEVELQHGRAWLSLADDVSVAPGCAPMDVAACEMAEWSFDCPCLESGWFGMARVRGYAADMLASVPSDLWASLHARNEYPCENHVEETPGNAPAGASEGGGYHVDLDDSECGHFRFFEAPEDWNRNARPEADLRGNVEICRDCLRDVSCDDLIR